MSQKRWEGWGWNEKTWEELEKRIEKSAEKEHPGKMVRPVTPEEVEPWAPLEDEFSDPEIPMIKLPTTGNKLPRVVHWRHHTGKWVVVSGPFPDRFYRSETRDDVTKAAKILVDDVFNRPGTTRDDQFAKVLASDIIEISAGENEFGPISP